MSGQCFIMSVNRMAHQNVSDVKPTPKEKVMSYEEKSVGSTPFFKCEACPYMALAEDDIKFHLFTVHPNLAKTNGLADNIQIPCPGCTSVFDAEETLRTHLRNHHKMGIKDVKIMVKSLVQIALKNAKLKKEDQNSELPQPPPPVRQEMADIKIPQVIEIVPDVVNANNDLPKGVAFISVDELHKMSTPNFEKVDPKEIIQEASINIVYTNDISTQYVSVSDAGSSNTSCNVIQVSSVPPDLISSIQPHVTSLNAKLPPLRPKDIEPSHIPLVCKPEKLNEVTSTKNIEADEKGTMCKANGCRVYLKDDKNLAYHQRCHEDGKIVCPECDRIFGTVDMVHTHLWKIHAIDLELPTCDVCGFKTYNRHRLLNVHMKCHKKVKTCVCSICSKSFKNANQLSKHKLIHTSSAGPAKCGICQREFTNEQRLRVHMEEVHEKLKPFKCTQCDYSAARKDQLRLHHMRLHAGDKPYACDQCSFRSGDHNSLRRHKKQHSKESGYKCKHCPYTTIQSTVFTSHMISKHPDVNNEIHRCPFCPFKSVNKEKYILHLTTHTDKEGIQLLIEMTKGKTLPPICGSWTIPSETDKSNEDARANEEQNSESVLKTVNEIPIEVYDCDSLSESLPQNYSKGYCTTINNEVPQSNYNSQVIVTDLSKDDNNSDCLISESSNDTMIERQYPSQLPLQMTYESNQSNLHGFLNTSVSLEQNLLQNSNVNSLASNHCSIASNRNNNIMSNFPIRLPPVPQVSLRNNFTLKPVDKISLSTTKVTGPIIKPTQILPVPSSSNSPVNITPEPDGVPRKKPKISVKSNLILKGPDQVNMFHSQQKMAFRRLEDNERFGLGGPVTFNNLITTQFMQLPPEPSLSESPNNIMPYPQETLGDSATTPVDNEMTSNPQIFSFNQQMSVTSMTMHPPPQKIQTNDPSYIKLEATIKQNTQSPSLERMCNANLLSNSAITREYKASPPLEDIHKNMSEIKNEVKSDSFYSIPMNSTATNPPILDQYLIDNIIGEQYSAHMDLSGVVLQEISENQNDVIEIDDNSDDNKLLPRLDMYFPLEPLYPIHHNDFHFLENEISSNIGSEVVTEVVNRMVTEVPIMSQKEALDGSEVSGSDFPNCIQGKKDPMMNTTVRPTTNKINVKNIELMKNY